MEDAIKIKTTSPVVGSIRPPGSKSITNRALVCAALADGTSVLQGALDSDDTRVMIAGLEQLGIAVQTEDAKTTLKVTGCGGTIPAEDADLSIGNSGTTMRFLTAMSTLGQGRFRLDGVPRMRERPIGDLLDALIPLGTDVTTEFENGCPPVIVNATGLAGGMTTIRGDISSQYLSGLMMAAPYAQQPVHIVLDGPLVSKPYVAMTRSVMKSFGLSLEQTENDLKIPAPQKYKAQHYAIEPDASAASYFWATAAITGGDVTVEGLQRSALQGDVRFCECLAQMGCDVEYKESSIRVRGGSLTGIDVDMNAISDTVQTLTAVALFATGTTRIRGVEHNRHKETDRIGDLATELRKFGAKITEFEDGLEIQPAPLQGATIDTYDDHRMAMSLALVGLQVEDVVIRDPGCTHKTYPGFFDDLQELCQAAL
ncbi:MAG: 3-phosphoshikimate 1-carboxyvinyltransferase [Planctomycetaceae bacterium]|nr:3-phosphoshikimate 1-carboxyvinyltransferase [Planctomycetaceae bacterium]